MKGTRVNRVKMRETSKSAYYEEKIRERVKLLHGSPPMVLLLFLLGGEGKETEGEEYKKVKKWKEKQEKNEERRGKERKEMSGERRMRGNEIGKKEGNK